MDGILRAIYCGWFLLSAGALSAVGTATTVRAHPWLTRGLERESLVGVRFEGSYGGALNAVTFAFTLEHCTKAELTDFRLWIQPGPAYAFYEPSAVRLDPGVMTKTETGDGEATTFTVTFSNPGFASVTQTRRELGWVFAADRVWLTASVSPSISRDASIQVDVTSGTLNLGGNRYAVANGTAKRAHRVYPYQYRINAYLRNDRMKGALSNRTSDIFDDAPAQRVANLTELTFIDLFPLYDEGTDAFSLSWDRKTAMVKGEVETVNDTAGFGRLRELRETYHPGARLHVSLTKGASLSLASHGESAFTAVALSHAAGDRYRAAFVSTVVTLLKEKQVDGLDIDWEYPDPTANNDEMAKYGLLLRDLSEAFFDHGWELAMCTNQSGWRMPGGEVLAAVDFVNSMAYGPWAVFLGNTVMTSGIRVCTERNVPKRRIVVGQAMYSNGSYQLGWNECVSRLRKLNDFTKALDADTYKEAWSYNGKSGDWYYFTGPSTYRAKCNRMRMEGYGGVMSWGYYSDVSWAEGLSLGMHQAQAVWPHDVWAAPALASDGFRELDSEEDWFWFREHPENNVRLTGDIVFARDPLPVESFSRTLDGNGHTLTFPADVWLCTFGQTALFRNLTGTVRGLTVDFAGRALTRADRANDTNATDTSLAAGNETAVLVANLGNGGRIEDVVVRLRPGAEVQGAIKTAAVVATAWCPDGGSAVLSNVRAEIDGTVRAYVDNSGGIPFDQSNACVGALVGWLGCPAGGGLRVENCFVRLGPAARIAAETGIASSAGGCVGNLNNGNPAIAGLRLRWQIGAEVTGKQFAACTPMPWVAAYYNTTQTPTAVSGAILSSGNFPWQDWWLRANAPLLRPGYLLLLR